MRIELTFSSGKFIAYDDVIKESIKKATKENPIMKFEVEHPRYEKNVVCVNIDKLDFCEFMDDEKIIE